MTGNNKELSRRVIEWEPYKAACSSNFPKQPPSIPSSHLIAYQISGDLPLKCRPDFLDFPQVNEPLINNNVQKPSTSNNIEIQEEDEQCRLARELQRLRQELEVEREINGELKRLLVNACLSEDLNCKLSSLAEDKVRLGKTIDVYHSKERNNVEDQEQLNIENMLWKSKFMAIAIRADDLSYNLNVALKLFKKAQIVISNLSQNVQTKSSDLAKTICELLNVDILALYNKSPCDERIQKQPFNSSLTITCCGRCSDKQIQLV